MITGDKKLYKFIIVGHLMINVPAILISFGLPALVLYFIETIWLKLILMFIAFLLGLGISWLLWSILVTKWRLWAFQNVDEDDWIKLKELAIQHYLIWEDGSDFEKTELRNPIEQFQISEISERLLELEEVEDIKLNLITPESIGYQFNKKEIYAETISLTLLLIAVVGLIFTAQYILALIMLAIIIFNGDGFKQINHLLNNKDYIVLSNQGIQLEFPERQFIPWEEVATVSIDIKSRKMAIFKKDGDDFDVHTVELWRYKISDYPLFRRRVRVFIERHLLSKS